MTDEPTPVFVIGAARSGTKFLRDTIAAVPEVAATPYDLNYVWRRGNERAKDDQLDPSDVIVSKRESIRRSIRRQAMRAYGEMGRPWAILEKTVSNTLRVPFVEEIFPGGLYLSLIRDGRDVVESAYRCWLEPLRLGYSLRKLADFPLRDWRYLYRQLRNRAKRGSTHERATMWGPVYRGMEEDLVSERLEVVVARQWSRCVEASLVGFGAVPRERVLFLRYEEIVTSEDWIPGVMRFIGLENSTACVVKHYRKTVRRPMEGLSFRTFNQAQRERIDAEIFSTMSAVGYT